MAESRLIGPAGFWEGEEGIGRAAAWPYARAALSLIGQPVARDAVAAIAAAAFSYAAHASAKPRVNRGAASAILVSLI